MTTPRQNRGFTLIELMLTIVLSMLISGVVVAALITSLNAASSTTDQVNDSTDAGLISSFLIRDAQSAGGIDPSTALADQTLGVSTDPTDADALGCASATPVVRFSWIDRSVSAQPKVVVSYALDGSQQLTRWICTYGTTTTKVPVVLGGHIVSASATCDPAPQAAQYCAGHPTTVTMTVVGKGVRAPLTSILTASLRSSASQLMIIGPPSLPEGTVGAPYQAVFFTTIGATPPTSWSITGGPPGLAMKTLDTSPTTSFGVTIGTPTARGTYSVTITATDKLGAKASKAYTITVHEPPVATADAYDFTEDTLLSTPAKGVLGNDTSPEGTPITAVLYSGVANGTLTFKSDGSFTYLPNPDFNGTDSFKYKASDGSRTSGTVAVTLTGHALNDPPVNRVPVGQETMKNTNKVFAGSSHISISDPDAGTAPVQVKLTAANGTITLPSRTGLSFSVGDGTTDATMTFTGTIVNINTDLAGLTFIPTANFTGAASLQIVTDDKGNSPPPAMTDTDSVAINVTPLGIFTANKDIGAIYLAGSSVYTPATNSYTVKGSGWDIWEANDGFQYLYRAMPGDGSLTARIASEDVTYNGAHNASLLCWAADNSHQQPCVSVSKAEVMFRAADLTSGSAIHGSVGMTQGNGSEYIYRTTAGATTSAASPADSLDAPYWVRLTRRGNQFTAEISADGVTWTQRGTPQTIAMGTPINVGLAVSGVYQLDTATNQKIKLNTVTFDNVDVSGPPNAVADTYSVNEDATLNVPAASGVLENDSDPDGDVLTADLVSGTAGLALHADGSFTYTPPVNFVGTATFGYSADDGILNSAPVTVTITVSSSNETPSFTKGPNQRVAPGSGPQVAPTWATAISAGAGETDQLVDFLVTNDNNALFDVQPAIAVDGTLTYTPAGGASGVATVSVALHDNGGTANGGIDTSAVQTFTITIAAAPVVTASPGSVAYVENGTAAVDPGVTITDADSVNLASATMTISAGYANGQDVLAFANQLGITGSWNAATGVLTMSGNASVASYQAAMRAVTYSNSSDNPSTAPRTVTFTANDGLLDSLPVGRAITVTAVNDAPVVAPTGGSLAYTENNTTALDPGLIATDADSANLASARVAIAAGYVSGQDALAFTNQSGITGTWNAGTGVLTLTGSATVASYQTALRSITYNDNSNNPNTGTRTVTFVANDGALDSPVASRTITVTAVNDAPTMTASTGSAAYTENGSTIVDSGTSVSDVDSTNLSSARVTITTNYVSAQDALVFTNQLGITGSWNATSGVLTLSGSATVANYQTALRSVTYTNSSNNPSTATRTITFVVNDGVVDSNTVARTVTVTAVNDAPVVVATAGSMAYTENTTTPVDPTITVTDADSTNLSSATVTMSAGYATGQDTLGFTNQLGITGTWNATTGVLTLSGTTTVANYQTAMRSITYNDNSNNPNTGARTVTFVASDGSLASNAASRTITVTAVNDASVVTASGGSMAYTENNTTIVDPGITVTDVDSANLSSARVTMTTGYSSTQDTLAFTNQLGITGSWNASTGVLTLSGSATVANYQTALKTITYNNSSSSPSTTTRTVTFVVNDGVTDSNTASRTITIATVNDAPVNGVPGVQTMTRNTTKTFSTANGNLISISDPDAGTSSVQVQLVSTNGRTTLSRTTGLTFSVGDGTSDTTVTFTGTIANINAALAGLRFTSTTNFSGTASVRIVTSDLGNSGSGGALTDSDTVTINVT